MHGALTPEKLFVHFDDAQERAVVKVLLSSRSVRGHEFAPAYLAPELLEGRRSDSSIDVFAFGVVVYELLTGRPPFPSVDVSRYLSGIRAGLPLPDLALPEALVDLLRSCTAYEPAARPRAARLADQLLEIRDAVLKLLPSPEKTSPLPAVRVAPDGTLVSSDRRVRAADTLRLLNRRWCPAPA